MPFEKGKSGPSKNSNKPWIKNIEILIFYRKIEVQLFDSFNLSAHSRPCTTNMYLLADTTIKILSLVEISFSVEALFQDILSPLPFFGHPLEIMEPTESFGILSN